MKSHWYDEDTTTIVLTLSLRSLKDCKMDHREFMIG